MTKYFMFSIDKSSSLDAVIVICSVLTFCVNYPVERCMVIDPLKLCMVKTCLEYCYNLPGVRCRLSGLLLIGSHREDKADVMGGH